MKFGDSGLLARGWVYFGGTHRLLSSSFWGLPSRILSMSHKKELLIRSLGGGYKGCEVLAITDESLALLPFSGSWAPGFDSS